MKLSEIVGMALDEFNLGKNEYARFYRFAIRGLRNLNWDVTGYPKEVEICLDCDLTAKLPDDFLREIKVGVDIGNGEISALTRNDNLSLNGLGSCDRLTNHAGYNYGYYGYYGSTRNSYNIGGSLGVGSHANIGEFKIDMESGLIVLAPDFCHSTIILRYLSCTEMNGQDLSIHEFASEALVSFIKWKFMVGNRKYSQGERLEAKNDYFTAKKVANIRLHAMTQQDMNQAARTSVKGSIRS